MSLNNSPQRSIHKYKNAYHRLFMPKNLSSSFRMQESKKASTNTRFVKANGHSVRFIDRSLSWLTLAEPSALSVPLDSLGKHANKENPGFGMSEWKWRQKVEAFLGFFQLDWKEWLTRLDDTLKDVDGNLILAFKLTENATTNYCRCTAAYKRVSMGLNTCRNSVKNFSR